MNVFNHITYYGRLLCLTLITLFVLSACGGDSSGGDSTKQSNKKRLPAPSNVVLTLAGVNQINISWDAVTNAEGYKVYASPKSINTLATPDLANYNTLQSNKIVPVAKGKTTHSLTGLDYASTYHVIVQSEGNGSSTLSNAYAKGQEKSVKTGVAAPQNVTMGQDGLKLVVSWNQVNGVSAYHLYHSKGDLAGKTLAQIQALESSTDANNKVFKTSVPAGTTQSINGLSLGDKRYGVVTAVVNNTESAPSAVANKAVVRFEKMAGFENKCVIDHINNLIWEVKQASGLHGKGDTYSWYNPANVGNLVGTQNAGACYNKTLGNRCDTIGFAQSVNAVGLCGHKDWRMPTNNELKGLVDTSKGGSPKIDTDFFPNTQSQFHWSSSAYQNKAAWGVDFGRGVVTLSNMSSGHSARLVRGR